MPASNFSFRDSIWQLANTRKTDYGGFLLRKLCQGNGCLKLDCRISASRAFIHKTNPVRTRRTYSPTLDLENFNLTEGDLDTEFEAGNEIGIGRAKLRDIVSHLQETYCKSIGVEYRYMTKPEIVQWLQNKMEGSKNQEVLSNETKLHVLDTLVEASGLEDYMHKKFVGQKDFLSKGPKRLFPLSIPSYHMEDNTMPTISSSEWLIVDG